MQQAHGLSIRQACILIGLSSSVYYHRPKAKDDSQVILALKDLSEHHYRWGFWMMYGYLRNEGNIWNHKRVYRVYTAMELNLRSKRKKRLPVRDKEYLSQPLQPNYHWSMDFMQDSLQNGGKFRTLNIIDDFNREVLAIIASKSITSSRVMMELENLLQWRGKPAHIRVDNGPEFIASCLKAWCEKNNIELKFIQPGKPAQNGFIERFNRTFREEVLSMNLFHTLEQVADVAHEWMYIYNHKRPHRSLKRLSPRAFLLKYGKLTKEFPTFQQDNNNCKTKKLYIEV